jgi:hypothetical protein
MSFVFRPAWQAHKEEKHRNANLESATKTYSQFHNPGSGPGERSFFFGAIRYLSPIVVLLNREYYSQSTRQIVVQKSLVRRAYR